MLTVVIIMISGILVGYLIRSFEKLVKVNDKLTTWAIYALLFLMGIGIGANKVIMNSLHTLGFKALIISIGGVAGSILLGWLTYRVFFKKSEQ
ncbi:MAG TPA: LysO family transporter [Tenuifilaceae bacterium]|nr:LysO family transporter [Tenuifilaceae bacterium]HOZ13680.1 LysO family transporter [Tenuifilaceae bacterium]HPI45099.1 LysO family transporter [Tenuifilaceae bacterium]HPN20366.1 LysO family transporter [Tenuifilaceae bacterium]HPV55652.1 LysO family transporter [Tenuifilaceae bacterium]